MMEDSDVLFSFYVHICGYFSGSCTAGKCSLVKKHKENLLLDGDFSIPISMKAQEKHMKGCALNNQYVDWCVFDKSDELLRNLQESNVMFHNSEKNLMECSVKWPVKIAKCQVNHGRLCLYLNKIHTFETILNCILMHGSVYGKLPDNMKKILLTSDMTIKNEWGMNMSNYRKNVVKCVLKNLLNETGHTVITDSNETKSFDDLMHYILASNPPVANSKCVFIHCGSVIDKQTQSKEKVVLAEDYLRQRCEELKEMSKHKHGQQVENNENWEKFFKRIGEATLRIDMLNVRPSRSISLNFHPNSQETSRNAHFILYNCARLAAIQEKFDRMISENVYPPLVPLQDVDFSLLKNEEEWELLSNYLLMYPHVLRSSVEFLEKGKPMPNLLVQFLSSLCGCYSSYYRRVRVLTESREHLLPVMFARIYLLKAVECVLHNGLRLLGIEPVRYM